jgi:NAD(P) transhydrogenase subunit beta
MNGDIAALLYLAAGVLFILALKGLSSPATSRTGNRNGMIGMTIAILTTLWVAGVSDPLTWGLIVGGLVIGGGIGAVMARRIAMTNMPQLVAAFHSLVGLAAVLVAGAALYSPDAFGIGAEGAIRTQSLVEMSLGVAIGIITFAGSLIAFAKLNGNMSGAPIILPMRHLLNLLIFASIIGLIVYFTIDQQHWVFWAITGLAFVFGITLIIPIGGADMPVVVSMLNSYSGWAAAAMGFTLENSALIITGALVGSSGAILSYIMCKGMNRSFVSVMLGGFGTDSGTVSTASGEPPGEVHSVDAAGASDLLVNSKKIIIVPGYGLAVAQAQHSLAEVVKILKEKGVEIKFAIHPVAGRLPGHMNVLLAEANIPYDIVFEMDEVNDEFAQTDVAWVIGANDIVNPSAMDDPGSPIAGMPVLHVWEARTCIVMKRGMASGYAGVDNPLFYKDNTLMLFGDAKKVVDEILTAMRS